MSKCTVLCCARSEAVRHAAKHLSDWGIAVVERPAPDVTHLLLPVPSFPNGDEYLAHLLTDLPDDVIISGGNLASPLLENYRAVDFLQDPYYLADNAAITAQCAIGIAENKMGADWSGISVLILGWGRIGKCLGRLLQDKKADVTIAARKAADLAMIHALGFRAVPFRDVPLELLRYHVIFNTVPELILPEIACRPDCIALELASRPGMTGENILSARGLPGKMAPAASGKLIAETFVRLSL